MIKLDELKMRVKNTGKIRIEIQRQTSYGKPEPKESQHDRTIYIPEVKS